LNSANEDDIPIDIYSKYSDLITLLSEDWNPKEILNLKDNNNISKKSKKWLLNNLGYDQNQTIIFHVIIYIYIYIYIFFILFLYTFIKVLNIIHIFI
jgi:F0F1-type ATP synthase gamma subunit